MRKPVAGAPWHKAGVATTTASQHLAQLRRLARQAQRRVARLPEAAPLIARVIGCCRTLGIERRSAGLAVRLQLVDDAGECLPPRVIHDSAESMPRTAAERVVAAQLCDGRTLAQIARLRGVSINTVKSQARQIFRKLDVDSRVALVRRLCP